MGWGFGVGVQTEGPLRGRYGWSGGQGTDFFVDPDGTVGILLTQVELGERRGRCSGSSRPFTSRPDRSGPVQLVPRRPDPQAPPDGPSSSLSSLTRHRQNAISRRQ